MSGIKKYYTIFDEDNPCNLTFAQDGFVSLVKLYFKEKTPGAVDGETFSLIMNDADTTAPHGSSFKNASVVYTSEKSLLVGFPEKTYNVPITVYRTSDYTDTLTQGAVTLTRGSTVKNYTISGSGHLVPQNETTETPDVALPAGTWSWEVNGGAAGLGVGKGTFTVDSEGNLTQGSGTVHEIKLYAESTGGGDTPAGTEFSFKLTDADTAAFIAGGNPTVSVDSVPAEAKLANDGTLTITTNSVDADKNVTISVPGYQTVTKSLRFFGSSVTSNGNLVNALALDKATTKVTLPTPNVDDAYVEIKDKVTGEVTVLTPSAKGDNVSVDLPDGSYEVTYVTPGSEDLTLTLEVDGQPDTFGNNEGNKVTVKDATGTTEYGSVNVDAADSATVTPDLTTDKQNPVENYPMYSIVGEWTKNGSNEVTGMTLKVYLKVKGMTSAVTGSFGFEYDKNVFDGDSATVSGVGKVETPITTTHGTKELELSQFKDGYVTVTWTTEANGTAIPASDDLVQIATVNLPFKTGVDNSNYKTRIGKTTLKEMTFTGSAWDKIIKESYGDADTVHAAAAAEQIWRTADDQNAIDAPAGRRLPNTAVYTTVGGFFQTFQTGSSEGYDTKTQLSFPYFTGNKEVSFKVTDGTNPVANATIKVTDVNGTTDLGTLTTDENGAASITVPVAGGIKYTVTANSFAQKEGEKKKADLNILNTAIEVALISSVTHKVELTSDSTNVTLTGGDAANKQDYLFDLTPKAGFKWPESGKPAGTEGENAPLTIKFVTQDATANNDFATSTLVLTASWDSARNAYVIPGDQITQSDPNTKIQIKVTTEPVATSTQYHVVVTSGNGGTFQIEGTPSGNSFDRTGATDGVVTETLAVGGTSSSTYKFKPDEPDEDNQKLRDEKKTYVGYVIDSVVINGTPATLTNHQKINGVSYQLTGIDQDQSIVVSYGKATIDSNGDISEPVDPQSEATVTLQLSDHGSAKDVTVGGTVKDATVEGPAAKTYQVDAGESLVVSFEGGEQTVGGVKTTYEVDSVTVDGVLVFKDGAAATDSRFNLTAGGADATNPSKGTLTLTGLAKGSNHTVVVLFKDSGSEESMFATLNVVRRGGDGTISPIGSQIKTIGLPVTITATAGTNSKLTVMDLQTPGAAVADVTTSATEASGTWTYNTPNLTAGTTTVGATFQKTDMTNEEALIQVRLDVQYPSARSKAATFIFVDGDGNSITYGPDVADEHHKLALDGTSNNVTHTFKLPAGTWTLFVSKNGCLDYILSGIVLTKSGDDITAGYVGNTSATLVEGGIVYLGHQDGTTAGTTGRKLVLTPGDTTWDGHLIAVNDIAQTASGLLAGAAGTEAAARADVDENGSATVNDMTIVLGNLGRYNTSSTYESFITASL